MGISSESLNIPFERSMVKSSDQNSLKTCKQAPHGIHGFVKSSSALPATAIMLKSWKPSETALKIAVRSAQLVRENEEFSILQPVKTLPSDVSRAAPTRKCEYGL